MAAYLGEPERYPVLSRLKPGELRASLPAQPPREGEPLAAILADIETRIVPGLTHWNHPGFFGYFSISSSVPGILAETLAAAFNVNAMLWRTSPAATELELVVLDWLRQLLALPEGLFGVVQDTASASTLVALAAAREAVPGLEARRRGLVGQARLRMYASSQAHSSVEKAAIVLGVGQEGFRAIAVDEEYRMDVAALERAIAEDRAAGFTPFAVTATVGTTSTTSVDPVPAIADVCAREGLWLHVDAAYGGMAGALPEHRHVLDGCERADSIVVNPHKWLFVPIDFSALYTRRPDLLRAAFSLVPDYLRTPEDDVAPNLMDYGVSLGRRFRALKLWMVMRAFGVEGIRDRLREPLRLAQLFRSWVGERRALRAGRAHADGRRLLPRALPGPQRRRGGPAQQRTGRSGQRDRRGVPLDDPTARPLRPPARDREHPDERPPRRPRLAVAPGDRCEFCALNARVAKIGSAAGRVASVSIGLIGKTEWLPVCTP